MQMKKVIINADDFGISREANLAIKEGYEKGIITSTSLIVNMSAFEQLLSDEDWKNYAIRIHGLKSNSLNIGAEELSKLCLALELAGKAVSAGESVDEKIQFIKENHPVAMKVYAAVIENAKDYLG